jgi:hypothetical protein
VTFAGLPALTFIPEKLKTTLGIKLESGGGEAFFLKIIISLK